MPRGDGGNPLLLRELLAFLAGEAVAATAAAVEQLTGDIATTPVLTFDGRSIGDSTRIIAATEERWPQPPLHPEDAAQRRRALELEEYFDEELDHRPPRYVPRAAPPPRADTA